MANLFRITPFMYVPDLEQALQFFTHCLDFDCRFRQGDYAYVQREKVAFRLKQNRGVESAPPGNGRICYYIDVDDVDAVAETLQGKSPTLDRDHLHGPIDQMYGQRELSVIAPDGNLIVFGQDIARPRD